MAELQINTYVNDRIDPKTGREWDDYGELDEAVKWILHVSSDTDPANLHEFLLGWEEGDLDEWPEYYQWLKDKS